MKKKGFKVGFLYYSRTSDKWAYFCGFGMLGCETFELVKNVGAIGSFGERANWTPKASNTYWCHQNLFDQFDVSTERYEMSNVESLEIF